MIGWVTKVILDVKNMRQLIALYEEGSVTGAARRLGVSQPALTVYLSRLEYQLSNTLFVRSVKGLEPTPVGVEIYQRSINMLRHWREFDTEVHLLAGGEIGKIRIACGAVIEQGVLPKATINFLQQHPHAQLDVTIINPEKMLAYLDSGETDIAIGGFNRGTKHAYEETRFASQRVGFYVRPNHPLFGGKGDVKSFKEYKLGCPEIPVEVVEWLASKGFSSERSLASNSYSFLKQVAAQSDVIVGGPHFLFTDEVEKEQLAELPLKKSPDWEGAILTTRTAMHSQLIRDFIACVKVEAMKRGVVANA